MKAIFFDTNATLLEKNLLPIAQILNERVKDFSAIFVSAEIASVDPEIERGAIEKITKHSNFCFIQFGSFSFKKIQSFLITHHPDIFFIDCYRIIDQLWVGIANILGVKTYMMQHGFEVDNVHYQVFSVFTKFRKGLRYLFASHQLSRLLKSNFFVLFSQYFKYIYLGFPVGNTLLGNKKLHPSKVFVYSDYYKKFWKSKYGFSENKTVVVTPPDFMMIEHIIKKRKQKALCYVSQTLVEDGRMKMKDFVRIMKKYVNMAREVDKFIIKLHPRSDVSLYDMFKVLDNIEITREFPNCTAYLTHYSSMAFVAAHLCDTVILHELPGHLTPQIYQSIASKIVMDPSEILEVYKERFLGDKLKKEEKDRLLAYYAKYENESPYEIIYQTIKSDCPGS